MPITECPTCDQGSQEDIELVAPDCPMHRCECSECDLRTLGEMEEQDAKESRTRQNSIGSYFQVSSDDHSVHIVTDQQAINTLPGTGV